MSQLSPIVALAAAKNLRHRIGFAQCSIFEHRALDVVDWYNEIFATSLLLGLQEFLQLASAGLALEVARSHDRNEKAGLVEDLPQLARPALTNVNVIDVLENIERVAAHLADDVAEPLAKRPDRAKAVVKARVAQECVRRLGRSGCHALPLA
jgi:hypothetical protein